MMLKVGGDYLDFKGSVEVEKKIKLFENLDSSDGDFSFQFDVPETSKNARLLSYPVPDSSSKVVYNRIDCDLQDDSGVSLYTGFLRVERRSRREVISLSFFSGNSNWFGLISGNLSQVDMSRYDIEQTEANIISSWSNTEGLVFPLLDNGGLLFRSYPQVKVEDFVAGVYVKTVLRQIFQSASIKLEGELLEDPLYNKLITVTNPKSKQAIIDRTAYIKTTNAPTNHGSITYVKIVWTDETTYPYFDGAANNFDLANSRYVADVPMVIKVEWIINNLIAPGIGQYAMDFYINGVYVYEEVFGGAPSQPLTLKKTFFLNAGDYIEAFVLDDAQLFADPLTDSTIRFTPVYLYKTYGESLLPDWTKQEYVSNIFQVFNVITSYEPKTRTLTCNLFDKLKEKEPIDISKYVTVNDIDYSTFVSSFGKQSLFNYDILDFDEVREYNIANSFRYSSGVIDVGNDFLSEKEEIVGLDFAAPFTYENGVFGMSIERTNLIDFDEDENIEASGVSNNGGVARFAIAEDLFFVGDLIRISESNDNTYNGEHVVSAVGTGWVEFFGLNFNTTSIGKLTKLLYAYNEDDNVYLMVFIPSYNLNKFSSNEEIYLQTTARTEWGLAYFSLIDLGLQINTDYKQSLSFGPVNDASFYQRTILETYWGLVSRVLNDPVKPLCTGVMPTNVYRSIDFLRPVVIKTLDTSNTYYIDRMSGYKSSYEPFEIELIKLA